MRSTGQRPGSEVGSRNQELGLDIVFKYLVRYPSGGQVGSWICKSGVKGGDQNSGDASLEAVFTTVGPSVIKGMWRRGQRTGPWALPCSEIGKVRKTSQGYREGTTNMASRVEAGHWQMILQEALPCLLSFPLPQYCQYFLNLLREAVTPSKAGTLSELCPRIGVGCRKPVTLPSDLSCFLLEGWPPGPEVEGQGVR